MGSNGILLFLFIFISLLGLACCDDTTSLMNKCSPALTKLTVCLDYAGGRSDTPTDQCCGSVSDIRAQDPACLCFIIQQAHDSGSSAIKSLGLRIDRLIQLPDACKLANSSVSNCPKLLKLSPSSPDIALFTNITKGTSPSTGSADAGIKSEGIMNQVHFGSTFVVVAVVSAIFLSVFSVGS